MDRQDGTGRGRRGDRKAGHGKGNWGKDGEENNNEENKEERPRREPREPRERKEREPREEKKAEEPVVEEEEVGFTLDDYMATRNQTGLLAKKEGRQAEKMDAKNIKDLDYKHDEKYTTKVYSKLDTVPVTSNANGILLGF